jgi:CRISPR-associated endoribonuclease Cas6/Csy4 subtype I-F
MEAANLTHYVEARILSLDGVMPSGTDVAFATKKIMEAVHAFNVADRKALVGFPEFAEKPVKGDDGRIVRNVGTGSRIRIFADMGTLLSFLVCPDFARLVGGGACTVGPVPIKEVPVDCTWEVYTRDRSAEKQTEGFQARAARRRTRRSSIADTVVDEPNELRTMTSTRTPPYVHIDSSSTGQRFRLFIKRAAASDSNATNGAFYGLGLPVPSF